MAEPRARVRQKGQVFSSIDLAEMLTAFSAPNPPHLPTTITALDEILTDFIIETCHAAALSASYSRRQKIKVDDFRWVLRKDERLLGRVQEQLWRERKIKEEKKVMDAEKLGAEGMANAADIADLVGERGEGEVKKKRGRKRKNEDGAAGPDEKSAKRAGS